MLVPALALGNVFAIILASVLDIIGKKVPSLSGNGQLMKGFTYEKTKQKYHIEKMGVGLLAALTFFTVGTLLGIHTSSSSLCNHDHSSGSGEDFKYHSSKCRRGSESVVSICSG